MPSTTGQVRSALAVRSGVAIVAGVLVAAVAGGVYALASARAAAEHEARWLRQRLVEKRTLVHKLETDLVLVAKATERLSQLASIARERNAQVRQMAQLDEERAPVSTPASFAAVDEAMADRSEDAARALMQLGFLENELAATSDSLALMTSLVKTGRRASEDVPRPKRAVVRPRTDVVSPYGLPVRGEISSGFGWRSSPYGGGSKRHTGVDIKAPYGTPVAASGPGVVVFAGRDSGGYGSTVVVAHGRELKTLYGHLSAIYVHEGQKVARGNPIGAVGKSGRARGVHLHYEVRVADEPVDPLRYARTTARTLTSREPAAIRPVARLFPSRLVGP